MKKMVIATTILLAAAACGQKQEVQAATQTAAAAQTAAAPAPASNVLAGKVVETFDGGGYTYLRIATASGEQWAAVPATQVKQGDTVSVSAQMTMQQFESKTLNRTFDTIVFGSIAGPSGAAVKMPPMMSSAPAHMKAPEADGVAVEKAPDGGKSVAELWSGRAALNGRQVVVRGKVVKFLSGIMGRNWMHIQDGTGSAEKGDNDITVTTSEQATVGSVVTVKGTLVTDKDFGAGYRYEVIIENANLQ